ncbi:ParB N-terminal domain-containing protein, partial [Pectobacterium carotovorum]|uniref:RHS repeat-associated core domain-containing protein n=1 Tax=Pectobacterium carotovorum TaxID=554 RepID=UPI00191C91D5
DTARLTEWQAGRLTQHDDTHYQYDKAGRLIRKQVVQPGYRPQVWNYRWDSRNQLRVVDTPTGERWFYRYDPFGRRTGKRCEQTQDDIRCLWDGDQIAEVRHYRSGERVARRHWVHNGWELLVQQRQNADGRRETDFVTSSQNGEPQALYRPDSTLRWQAPKSTLWGQRPGSAEDPADPGLGFAGQYRDTESGLCYNRFRYYDPAGGCYISPDPIGVLGGESNYGYVSNPLSWIDPLGLAGCETANVSDLIPTHSPNKSKNEMRKLLDAIKSDGKINESIKYVTHDGKMYIVDGHHRYFSAKKLGIESVPVEKVELPFRGYNTSADLFDEVIRMPGYWRYL